MSWVARTLPYLRTVIEKREASNTQAGLEDYSHHLMTLFAGDRTSKANLDKMSKRLAGAEIAARNGERGYVSEGAIADAFNDLMRQVRGRDGAEIRTTVEYVHRMREWDDRISPALSSVETHPSECLPGEALFMLVMLVSSNGAVGPAPEGRFSEEPPSKPGYLVAGKSDGRRVARILLDRYARKHWRWQSARLYGQVLRDMGI